MPVERRDMHCYVKIQGDICSGPRIGGKMETKLNLISEMSKSDKELRFKTLMHLVNVMNLRKCFYMRTAALPPLASPRY